MSTSVPNRVFFRKILLHCFILKKSAYEAHGILVNEYDNDFLLKSTCGII